MGDELTLKVDELRRAITSGLGSEIALLEAISKGMGKALATREWRYVEVTRQTIEGVLNDLTAIHDTLS